MISLSSDITDSKGRLAARGWVFFDRECPSCASLARRFRRTLEKRGFGLAALQDPRVHALLDLPPEELLREMRVATCEGQILGGAEAIIYLADQIWWAWPIFAVAKIPGFQRLFNAGYRWLADRRMRASGECSARKRNIRKTSPGCFDRRRLGMR